MNYKKYMKMQKKVAVLEGTDTPQFVIVLNNYPEAGDTIMMLEGDSYLNPDADTIQMLIGENPKTIKVG